MRKQNKPPIFENKKSLVAIGLKKLFVSLQRKDKKE